ncbi:MAG: hypothetical protein ACTSYR_04505 [Candidatus Odinarchaeia archaeon]
MNEKDDIKSVKKKSDNKVDDLNTVNESNNSNDSSDPPLPFSFVEEFDINAWADGYLEWIKKNFRRERD